MKLQITKEPSDFAQAKGFKKGQIYKVLYITLSTNRNYPHQECFIVDSPIGAPYCFYSSEIKQLPD